MPATRKDLVIDAGATFTLDIQRTDANDNAIDLTGYAANMIIRKTLTQTLDNIAGVVTEDGWIHLKATDEETAVYIPGKYSYTLDLTSPEGDVERLLIGQVNVRGVLL